MCGSPDSSCVSALMSPNQIEKWEEEDPNQVDQVPVQADVIDGPKVLLVEMIFSGANQQPSQNQHATQDVNGVNAGHTVVDAEKQTGSTRLINLRWNWVSGPARGGFDQTTAGVSDGSVGTLGDGVFVGLENAIRRMRDLMDEVR